jgi:CBS domain-containing protein
VILGISMSYYVKDYMEKEFPTLEVEATVVAAAKILDKEKKGYIIVLDKGKPYGIVTEWDLVSKVLATEKDPKKLTLKEIATKPVVTIDPDEDLLKASELMQKKDIKRLPVVKGGVIYGVITSTNIAQKCGEYVNKSVKDILRWSFPIG